MKKLGLLLAAFGFAGCIGLTGIKSNPVMAKADDDIVEPADETAATVVIEKVKHGSIEASIVEGHEGDVCELNIRAELLYLVSKVSVNGTVLVEDENISGLYKFALVRGENIVSAQIVVNEELLGQLSTIYAQARDKDWTNLFTLENLIALIKWVLDCGVLIALIRYYIRDKRLASKVEKGVKESVEKVIPESTKKAVVATVEEVVGPMFSQIKADNVEIMRAMSIFSKAMALMQEGTPESRIAILDMLSNLNISDEKTLAEVKAYIDKLFAEHIATVNEVVKALEEIGKDDSPAPAEEPETPEIDGTSI
jgi:hypothetical protein